MIQRIQSLYLFLVSLLTALMFLSPVSIYKLKLSGADSLLVNNMRTLSDHLTGNVFLTLYPLTALALCIILLSLFTIFLFRNRKMQVLLCRINFLLVMVLLSMLYFYIDFQVKCFTRENAFDTVFLLGSYFPFASLFLIYLSIRGIKKDESLVRAADRLR